MKKSLLLTIGMALGIGMLASSAQAQGYYNQPSYGYQGSNHNNYHAVLGQNVSSLHQYGSHMTNTYGREVNGYGCRNSNALYAEMQRYNAHTASLVNAYRGTCPVTYRKCSTNVHNSFNRIQTLQRSARVSPHVAGYIARSRPIASYVNTNYGYFQPRSYVSKAPVVNHHYSNSRHSNSRHSNSRHHRGGRNDGFDVKSAILGAIAGRVIHGAVKRH